MADPVERHTDMIHLTVEIVSAATRMIESIGGMKLLKARDLDVRSSYEMRDLRKSIKKASDAIAAYDICIEAGMSHPSRDEWDSALARASVSHADAARSGIQSSRRSRCN